MYPIRFENLYYDKIWGGRDLEEFRTNLPQIYHKVILVRAGILLVIQMEQE